jgi:hypothetical protein
MGPAARDPLCPAVEAARKAGIVVVVAAGNQGRSFPASSVAVDPVSALVLPGLYWFPEKPGCDSFV